MVILPENLLNLHEVTILIFSKTFINSMNAFRRFWDKIRIFGNEFKSDMSPFVKDVRDKTYEELVSSTAKVIVAFLFALFLVYGGKAFYDRIIGNQEEANNYVERELRGVITDADSSTYFLAKITVGIVGESEAFAISDGNGLFRLKFKAHKDSTQINLSFSGEGYEPAVKYRSIPLNENAENYLQKFTLKKIAG